MYVNDVSPEIVEPFNCHWYDKPAPELAVKITDPPEQKVVGPEAVIVALGSGFTVTVVALEVVGQAACVTTTV